MKVFSERKLIRWLHIIASVPIVGYIYGPVSQIPRAVVAVHYIIFPAVVLSGLWLWKGSAIKNLKRGTTERAVKQQTSDANHLN